MDFAIGNGYSRIKETPTHSTMIRPLAVIVVIAAIAVAWTYTLNVGDRGPASPEAPLPPQEARAETLATPPAPIVVQRHPVAEPEPTAEPARHLAERPGLAEGPGLAGDLEGLDRQNLEKVNRVLRRAGRATIRSDAELTADDLAKLDDMVTSRDKAINKAADAVLDFQDPHADEMIANIKQAVDSGSKPPYEVLPNGRAPERGPYDLLITSSYQGVVYAHKVPVSQELLNTVDAQRLAETLRLDAYTQFAASFQ